MRIYIKSVLQKFLEENIKLDSSSIKFDSIFNFKDDFTANSENPNTKVYLNILGSILTHNIKQKIKLKNKIQIINGELVANISVFIFSDLESELDKIENLIIKFSNKFISIDEYSKCQIKLLNTDYAVNEIPEIPDHIKKINLKLELVLPISDFVELNSVEIKELNIKGEILNGG